jgi:hypothetical protein
VNLAAYLRSASALIEDRETFNGESPGNAITSCVGNARVFRQDLMFRGALLGKSPLASTSFANHAINEILEATPNRTIAD